MKKFILPILLFLMFIPFAVNAEGSCNIVSGNGKDIGSEIACGTEHFYIIDSDTENIKMLAKYNLYTGSIIDKKEELFTSSVASNLNNYCQNKYGTGYKSGRTINNPAGEKQYFCYKTEQIEVDEIKQSEIALGAHGGYEGKPEFPEIGVVQQILVASYNDSEEDIPYFNYDFKEYMPEYFVGYEDYLNSKNLDIKNIQLITIDEINNIVKKTTTKSLPLDEWGIESWETILYHYGSQDDGGMYYYKVGSLKDNIDNKYAWLWSTTYWTQTMYYHKDRGTGYIYFVDTLGNICADYDCPTNFGAGIRPVITISKDSVIYKIETKTDGNGTIEVLKEASGGESITFRVSNKKEFRISKLTITTDSGEVVQFNEEDITTNSDGTISISTNKFTMPYENVTIEARWAPIIVNPNTGTNMIYIPNINVGMPISALFVILILMSITSMVIMNRIKNKKYITK